jgi:hypothetical protein
MKIRALFFYMRYTSQMDTTHQLHFYFQTPRKGNLIVREFETALWKRMTMSNRGHMLLCNFKFLNLWRYIPEANTCKTNLNGFCQHFRTHYFLNSKVDYNRINFFFFLCFFTTFSIFGLEVAIFGSMYIERCFDSKRVPN